MKNRIEHRYRLSLNRTVLRLTGTKILQKSDIMRPKAVFFTLAKDGECGFLVNGANPFLQKTVRDAVDFVAIIVIKCNQLLLK